MLEHQKNNSTSKPKENGSFSFMKLIAEYIPRLTQSQVNEWTRDGDIRFTREGNSVRIAPGPTSETVRLRSETVSKRCGTLVGWNGKVDRSEKIEHIVMTENSTTRSTQTIGSLLASAKNSFRESDSKESIDTLSTGDQMYIRFVDDTYAYSISVKNSSRPVNGELTALCEVTYMKRVGIRKEEVTEECIIRLPLRNGHAMLATSKGKAIGELHKRVANIKLRRRKSETTH